MGNHSSSSSCSKRGSSHEPSVEFNFTNQSYSSDPNSSSYDPDLHSFASNLRARTNHVISTLASEGVQVKALSLDSLKQVTECLTEMNFEVVNVIAQCKDDIWNNQELFQLVEEYFENSLATLDFCTALEKKLKLIRDRQLMIIKIALQRFQDEDAARQGKYPRTLLEFVKFREAEDPFKFKVYFFDSFRAVYQRQMSLLDKLKARKNKLDKKLKYIHGWRRVTNVLFVATFAAVLICSAVTALVAAGPVASAVAAAAAIPLGSVGKYIDSLWKNYEDVLKGQKEILSTMNVGARIAIKDLENIQVLVDRLQIEIESVVNNVVLAIEEEREVEEVAAAGVAVRLVAEEVKKSLELFERNVDVLEALAARCAEDIRKGRSVLIQRIIKHPNK